MTELEKEAAERLHCTREDAGIGPYEFHGCPGIDGRWELILEDEPVLLDVTEEENIPAALAGTVERHGLNAPFKLLLTRVERRPACSGSYLLATYRLEDAVTTPELERHARNEAALKAIRQRLSAR